MIKKLCLLIITVFFGLNIYTQQSYLSNFYMINPYLINPAEAGSNGVFTSFLSLREQWVGIEGAPSTAFLTAAMPISNNFSVGMNISNDNIHLFNQLNALATFNYKLKINNNQNLYFALSSGVINNKLDTKKAIVEDESDILYYQDLSGVAFNSQVGIKYNYKINNNDLFSFGLSANNLFANDVKFTLNDSKGYDYFGLNRNYNIYVNYNFNLIENLKLEPMVLIKYSENIKKYNTEIGFLSTYKDLVWGNIIYRFNESVVIGAGVNIIDNLSVAYSYGYGINGISSNSYGSHEVSVGFTLKTKNKTIIDTLDIIKDIYVVDTVFIKDTIIIKDTVTKVDSIIVQQKIGKANVDFKVNKGLHLVYGSYKVKENAYNELERLKLLGLNPEIIVSEDKNYQRIVIGTFLNDNEALIYLSELKKIGINNVWIWRVK